MEKVVFEIPQYQVVLVRKGTIQTDNSVICTSSDAAKLIKSYLKGADREHFVGLYLDAANHPLGIHTISVGIVNSSIVHPREVFKLAFMINAVSIIVAHNHPSGDPTPSIADKRLTSRLVEAAGILGISLQDHLIVTEQNGYVSLAKRGLLKQISRQRW
ncbi:MAG: DNA repair protein RadC [Ignavibacteriales bacterium]|nr:DNA repair protein RadC [Ignavibacteriales bacterium]